MALFGKKKDDTVEDEVVMDDADASSGGTSDDVSPEKAANFFSHAKVKFESENFEYAAQLFLGGLRWNPANLDAVDWFWRAVQEYIKKSKKKSPSKDIAKAASDAKGPVRRYLQEITNASFRWDDANAVLKAAEAAVEVDAPDVGNLFGQRAYVLARQDKKPRKDLFVRLMNVFSATENFKLAVESGETARQLDPSDGQLQNQVRNMMAQQTMARGGFDEAGQEGGFRRNIRDAAKQAELEAADRIAKTEDVKDRLVEAAKRDYEANPDDVSQIDKYGRALRERGRNADLRQAILLYNKAYSTTNQFRFRQAAGELSIRLMKKTLAHQQRLVEQNPDDAEAAEKLEAMRNEINRKEVEELKLQVENYPTDLGLKFRMGIKLFELGRYDDSIEYFQEARSDARNRGRVLYYLGRAFSHIEGWESEAIHTLRQAIEELEDSSSDLGLELRYDLMTSLERKARRDRDHASAMEADELAASIAMQRFNFRDIREKRTEIKKLMDELKD